MPRVNHFIYNSKFLSPARTTTKTELVILPAGIMDDNSNSATGHVDLPIASEPGAMARYQAQYPVRGDELFISLNRLVISGWYESDAWHFLTWYIFWERKDANTIRVNWTVLSDPGDYGVNYPSIAFKLKASMFRPPNIS